MGSLVSQNGPLLGNYHRTQYLHHRNLITGLRRPPSIKDLVVRARTDFHSLFTPTPISTGEPGTDTRTFNICTTKSCRYWARLDTSGTIVSTTTGRSYRTKINVSCKSSNLIYCIHCTRCKAQYVGQTERKLMTRASEHFAKITHSKVVTDMGKHFCTSPHLGLEDVRLYVLDFIHSGPPIPHSGAPQGPD